MRIPSRHNTLLALPLAAALSLTACDGDTTSADLREVSIKLDSLAAAGAQAPSLDLQRSTFQSVASTARQLASDASGGQKAAANLLIARAENGLAEAAYAEGTQAAREARSLLNEARSGLGVWLSVNSHAQAITTFNPESELARVRALIPLKEQEVAEAKSELAAHDTKVADLRSRSEGLQSQALDLRDQQTQLDTRAMSAGAVEAAQIAEQKREVSREADTLEADAARLRSEADVLDRGRATLALGVSQRESQLALLEEAINDLTSQQAIAQEEAEKLVAAGEQAVANMRTALDAAGKIHTERTVPLLEEAETAFGRARSAAQQARSIDRQAAGAQIATATHGNAGALLAKAEAIAERLATLEAIVGVEPGVPGRNELTDEMLALRDVAKAARTEATDAYREAIDSIEGIGARGEEEQARLDRSLVNMYAVLGEAPPAEVSESAAQTFESDEPLSTGGPETVEAFFESLRTMIESQDFSQARSLVRATEEPSVSILADIETLIVTGTDLGEAMTEQFGEDEMLASAETAASANALPGVPSPQELDELLNIENLVINYEGDNIATVTSPDAEDGELLYLSNDGTGWAIDLDRNWDNLPAEQRPVIEALLPLIPTIDEALQAVAQEIRDGTYSTPEEATAAIQTRLLPIIFGAMSQMPAIEPETGGE